MRKFLIVVTGIIFIIMLLVLLYFSGILNFSTGAFKESVEEDGIHYAVRVNKDQIERYDGEEWSPFIVKGISLSDSIPDKQQLSEKELEKKIGEWLVLISEMNINTIRISSIQSPALYHAIYDFNQNNPDPIYVIHDIPLQEELIYGEYNGSGEELSKQLHADIKKTIDILHGRRIVLNKDVFSSKWYAKDISAYVLGYVIGNQWDPAFVKIMNMKNQEDSTYNGKYIAADQLNGIEYILADALDYTIEYETQKYNQQRLVSFLNTIELDPVVHVTQSKVFRDTELNVEKLHITDEVHTGIFASYQASPHDSDLLNINIETATNQQQGDYFEAYLQELKSMHQKPIVITSIGLSTARAMSKEDECNHYSRGGMNEKQQGEYLTELLDDIYHNQYAGAIVYNWQDEWNKSMTWNIRHIKNTSNTEAWLDVQSSEQQFGIMQFVPGKEQTSKVDGKTDDWHEKDLLYDDDNNQLYATYNSSYLYLMIKKEDFNLYKDKLLVAIDVNPSIGTKSYETDNHVFDLDADFVARINGKNNSDIQVQSRYDVFDYRYKYYSNTVNKLTTIPSQNTNVFDPIYLLTRNAIQIDETMETLPPKYMETGTLVYGNSDYDSEEYNSLADFYVKEDIIELRIPWLLINVVDPMKGIALGDFYKDGLDSKVNIDQIGIQVFLEDEGHITKVTSPSYIRLKKQNNILYHERTKESYEVLQAYFKNLDAS